MKTGYKSASGWVLGSLAAIGVIAASAPVSATTIFSENFEAVTVDETTALVATPTQMSANTRTFAPITDATESSFNVRFATNTINGGGPGANFGNTNFDAFFTSKFLVIGDNSAQLGGDPSGTNSPTLMTLTFDVPHVSAASYLVSFSYVFDANDAANPDDFLAQLVFTDNTTMDLLNFGTPSATTRGFSSTALSSGGKTVAGLRFTLTEFNGNGTSAIGVDDIIIAAVPEPGALSLLGAAFLAFSLTKRERKQ